MKYILYLYAFWMKNSLFLKEKMEVFGDLSGTRWIILISICILRKTKYKIYYRDEPFHFFFTLLPAQIFFSDGWLLNHINIVSVAVVELVITIKGTNRDKEAYFSTTSEI